MGVTNSKGFCARRPSKIWHIAHEFGGLLGLVHMETNCS